MSDTRKTWDITAEQKTKAEGFGEGCCPAGGVGMGYVASQFVSGPLSNQLVLAGLYFAKYS